MTLRRDGLFSFDPHPEGSWVLHFEYAKLETELRDTKALHASIIEQGRLVGAGAMSPEEYIDWVRKQLEGK
jgi:hypothetical protein